MSRHGRTDSEINGIFPALSAGVKFSITPALAWLTHPSPLATYFILAVHKINSQ